MDWKDWKTQWERKKEVPFLPMNQEKEAAVFLPLIWEDEWKLLFEQRSQKLKSQPGEICFPGGRVEEGEHPMEAACRELQEELLIQKEQILSCTAFYQLMGPNGGRVWSFVGEVKDYEGSFQRDEVNRILKIPIRSFQEQKPRKAQVDLLAGPQEDFPFDWIQGGRQYSWAKKKMDCYFYQIDGVCIWGMTANLVRVFMETLKN